MATKLNALRCLSVLLVMGLGGCASLPAVSSVSTLANNLAPKVEQPSLSPSELRSLQTHLVDVDRQTAFAAVITVLMDEGYRIETAALEPGLIIASASTAEKVKLDLRGFVASKQLPTAQVFVEETPSGTRVRTSFGVRQSSGSAGGISDVLLLEASLYRNFFRELDAETDRRRAYITDTIGLGSNASAAEDSVSIR